LLLSLLCHRVSTGTQSQSIEQYPQPMPQPPQPAWSASLLRRDLSARAQHLARTHDLLHEISPGSNPAVIFGRDDHGRHGNFHPASDTTICANPAWLRRLAKPHTASRRSRARKDWQWMELDSANSSDALLMNIFCHPGVFNGHTLAPAVASLLNVDPTAQPCFGINPGVPLKTVRKTKRRTTQNPQTNLNQASEPQTSNTADAPDLASEIWALEAPPTPSFTTTSQTLTDRTEIDLQLGNLFLEAKLTESNFQTAAPRLIERYRDLETVFDLTRLPRKLLSTPATHPPAEDYSQIDPEFANSNEAPTLKVVIPSEAQRAQPRNPRISPAPPLLSIATQAPHTTPNNPKSTRTLIQGYQLIRNVLAAYASDAGFCVLCDARRHDLIEIWYRILSAVHSPTFATRLKLLTWQELSTTLPHDLQQFLEAKYGIRST
jgi:hypothetical protein